MPLTRVYRELPLPSSPTPDPENQKGHERRTGESRDARRRKGGESCLRLCSLLFPYIKGESSARTILVVYRRKREHVESVGFSSVFGGERGGRSARGQ